MIIAIDGVVVVVGFVIGVVVVVGRASCLPSGPAQVKGSRSQAYQGGEHCYF